ncbi:MAG: DMT family transporter [Sphingomonadales bacterium]|nr:DMT family transporter [Sphingomonadales bacterium]
MASTPPSAAAPSLVIPVVMVIAGLASYSAMDAVMKALVLALGAFDAIFWRMLIGIGVAGMLFVGTRTRWPARRVLRIHLIRGVVTAAMGYAFFWGLGRVPLAEAIALSFIAPLIALYLAALLLKERVGRTAIVASLLGIAGVLVILAGKIDGDFPREAQLGVAAILFAAVLYAWNLILQRQQALVARPVEIAFFQYGIVTLIYLPLVPFFATVPAGDHWIGLASAALLGIVSMMAISWGYARAEAQHLVSLEYSAFLWAALFGWLFFDEAVTWATFAGTVLIVSGCLLIARKRPAKAEIVEAAAV